MWVVLKYGVLSNSLETRRLPVQEPNGWLPPAYAMKAIVRKALPLHALSGACTACAHCKHASSRLYSQHACNTQHVQVRAAAAAAAAALMEGPRQRAYLAMAEHYDSHMHR